MTNPLSSRRYTECVDRLNIVLGRLSRWLEQNTVEPQTKKPPFTTIDANHRIVKCGNNVYKYSLTPMGKARIFIWKDGWTEVLTGEDDRDVTEIIENFEWNAQP
jgi:hypothetical protein